jgi:hypothetical protein
LEHARKVLTNLVVPEPHDAIPVPGDLRAPCQIGRFLHSVLTAIDLNGELVCRTGEIDDVPADRMLSTKAGFRRRPSKHEPQEPASVASRRSLRAFFVRSRTACALQLFGGALGG